MTDKQIWALNGYSHAAPENTFPSYWGALGAGADGLFIGLQLSSDGKLICVSGENLNTTTGKNDRAANLTAEEIRGLDAGSQYHSRPLDADNRYAGDPGKETPWSKTKIKRETVYHPEQDEVLLHLGRRTRFIFHLQPAAAPGPLADAALEALQRSALIGKAVLAGDLDTLIAVGERGAARYLVPGEGQSPDEALAAASQNGISTVVLGATAAIGAPAPDGVQILVTPDDGYAALSPVQYTALADNPKVAGFLVPAVSEMHALANPRGVVAEDDFAGNKVNGRLWALGDSKSNDDSKIRVKDGLHIEIKGKNYAGSSAFTTFSIHGGFDARMSFEVANPQQGTTFEIAAVHVDAGYHRPNLTFDVHGAPPYASSERDENDGFRIGWNNGPALTRWRNRSAESSNLYNNYGRDVGNESYPETEKPTGALRLTRSGYVYNAYYRDKFHDAWVLSGSVPVPALADAVFLRLGGKHWPKGGKPAPDNHFRLWDFKLEQW